MSEEQKHLIVALASVHTSPYKPSDIKEIAEAIGVHPKTVSRVLKLHKETGWVRRPRCEIKTLGRPRKLTSSYGRVSDRHSDNSELM